MFGKLNVLVVGADGNLGSVVYAKLKSESCKPKTNLNKVFGIGRITNDFNYEVDWTDYTSVINFFETYGRIDVVINCIAYTNTTKAEASVDDEVKSFKANVMVPNNLARVCINKKMRFIHISSDYVTSEYADYNDICLPINVYGTHKHMAELYITNNYLRANSNKYLIIRTSWLYNICAKNNNSFIHKVLDAAIAQYKHDTSTFNMVDDVYSIPTAVETLADWIMNNLTRTTGEILYIADYCSKIVSRYDFAKAIIGIANVLLDTDERKIELPLPVPVKSTEIQSKINYPKSTFTIFNNELYGSTYYNNNWFSVLNYSFRSNKDKILNYILTKVGG